MKKTALLIMIITLFSKLLGFGREIVLSYFFGASSTSDAYLISLTVPSVIFGLIGVGIVTAYIPMQSRVQKELGEESGDLYTSNFVNIILLIVTLVLFFCLIFTENIINLFAMGFTKEALNLTVKFTRITIFGMYSTALISIFSGYLQIKNNYIVPALLGVPLNIIIIISIIIASKGNYILLGTGTLIGVFSQFLLMVPFILKKGYKHKLRINFRDERIIKTLYIALPVIIGTSVNQINILVDRTIASSLAIGGISALNYADRLNLFIQGLFVTSIITALYPLISNYAAEKNYDDIKKALAESINIISIFVVPITIGTLIFSEEIVKLLFGRGAFDLVAVKMTSTALFFYSFGMIGFGLREVLSRVFYSLQDTKTPMINAAIGVIINIILNIVLSRYLGIGGLALATSIAAIITTLLLFFNLRKKIGVFGLKRISFSFIKIFSASIVMGFIAKLSHRFFLTAFSENISLIIGIFVGSITYFLIIYIIKVEEVDLLVSSIKNRLKK